MFDSAIQLFYQQHHQPALATFHAFATLLKATKTRPTTNITQQGLAQQVTQKTTASRPKPRPSIPTQSALQFCWTHGVTFHNGRNCKHPKPGHQPTATLDNPMGGNVTMAPTK